MSIGRGSTWTGKRTYPWWRPEPDKPKLLCSSYQNTAMHSKIIVKTESNVRCIHAESYGLAYTRILLKRKNDPGLPKRKTDDAQTAIKHDDLKAQNNSGLQSEANTRILICGAQQRREKCWRKCWKRWIWKPIMLKRKMRALNKQLRPGRNNPCGGGVGSMWGGYWAKRVRTSTASRTSQLSQVDKKTFKLEGLEGDGSCNLKMR